MELCLGTVQFGMQYGVAGHKKPSILESLEMLDYATQNGISTIDTANTYGSAEIIVGEFLNKRTVQREKIKIISKLQPNLLDSCSVENYYGIMKECLVKTFQRLHVDYLDGFLLHSSRYVFHEAILHAFAMLKKEGYVKKIGVSVYEPAEAAEGIKNADVELLQLPYSIFDQRMKEQGIFALAAGSNVEIHTRSAFLQGLILMQKKDIPKHLKKAVPIVEKIDQICEEYSISKIALALHFVKQQKNVGCLVFGVHNISQLKENIDLFHQPFNEGLIAKISSCFENIDANIIMPSLWHKE